MAANEDPEVQFAQRLACNETSIRNKALKKLRKYISARSHKPTGGFTDVELLKLWKGLFYCVWMQDKPLLQEDLSHKISTLIHNFHHFDTKLLYFVSFLQTVKREWTGIDRLRMDKFYQLVRFMFRQAFELLKRNSWDTGDISKFLDVLTAELLKGGSGVPSGVQLHVLDLYLTELAVVGSEELTADQNLTFIEPFCKTAAKTKDRTLFSAICSNVFSAIIDQAPFAIQDLIKELEKAGLGQASEDEDQEEEAPAGKNKKHNLSKSKKDDDDDEDDMLDLEDEDSEMQGNIGPVLQFDYSAVAKKLFELSSRSSTPGTNRQRLYRIVKVLQNLSEGIFPNEDYPEEVSTDEDDDMFATRKKLKRMKRRGLIDEDLNDSPAAKKMKKKKTVDKSNESADTEVIQDKKKKKKKKAKVNNIETVNGCGGSESFPQESSEALKECVPEKPLPSEPTDQSQEEGVVTEVSSDSGHPAPKKRKRKKKEAVLTGEEESTCEATGAPQTESGHNVGEKTSTKLSELSSQAGGGVAPPPDTHIKTHTKKKKKGLKETHAEQMDNEASKQKAVPPQANDTTPPQKKGEGEEEGVGAELQVNGVSSETHSTPQLITAKKKSKRKNLKLSQAISSSDQLTVALEETLIQEVPTATEQQDAGHIKADIREEPQPVLAKRKRRKIPVVIEFEADELGAAADQGALNQTQQRNDPAEQQTTLNLKKTKKKVSGETKSDFISFQSKVVVPTPLFCKTRGNSERLKGRKKSGAGVKLVRTGKIQTPNLGSKKVTFGLKNNKTAEFKKTDRSLLLSPDGSSRVPFDPTQKPKCGVLKSPGTRLSASIKRNHTPKPHRRPAAADFF